jgi:hypothetical protein
MINSCNSDKQVGLFIFGWAYIQGGLIFGMRWALVHEVSVSTCGGLIRGGGDLYMGGLYLEIYGISCMYNTCITLMI